MATALQGNTPACAGKSCVFLECVPDAWKYPRVRGEETITAKVSPPEAEIPPRARGRGIHTKNFPSSPGNTPACAGKSILYCLDHFPDWKYPRVRGEEPC